MVKVIIGFAVFVFITGCANKGVKAEFGDIVYDYLVSSSYPLTDKHKAIYLDIDGDNLIIPQNSLKMETLKLNWVTQKKQAQVILHLRISNSFLIQRPAGVRTNVVFNDKGIGHLENVPILRGFIRTHYQIELVDTLNDQLIDHFQGAHNFPVESIDLFNHQANVSAMQIKFDQQASAARKALMENLWENIQGQYLVMVQVSFGKEEFHLVKSHENDPRYLQAFNLLSRNTRLSAAKALNIYNKGIKDYQELDDDIQKYMNNLFDYGITVSSRISNHGHQDRFPNGVGRVQ